jgi:hypothetical protein
MILFLFAEQGDTLFSPLGYFRKSDNSADTSEAASAQQPQEGDAESPEEAGAAANAVQNVPSNSKPSFTCDVCEKNHKRRSELKQHLFSHFRTQIQVKTLWFSCNRKLKHLAWHNDQHDKQLLSEVFYFYKLIRNQS